ncbi:hypothetical protein CIK76_05260 [Glutamicibacter sp. BW80]|nr:hypothetical protein CIK76_05260 [Glutamicibacter sp. BW80]
MSSFQSWLLIMSLRLTEGCQNFWRQFTLKMREERGDVPGWTKIFGYYMKKPPAMKLRAFLTVAS